MARELPPEDALNIAEGEVTLGLSSWDWLLSKLPKDEITNDVRAQAFKELAYWLPSICEGK